jgi:hypothetical protein
MATGLLASGGAGSFHRKLARWSLGLLLLGVVCRAVRYLLQFPYWGDESFLCLNFVDRDYLGLTRPLDGSQVAPFLWLWGELAVYHLLGGSELAMRLLPFLAGLGALGLFWHLTRQTLSPLAATLAFGLLAVARWPVSMSAFVKPYSFDLFMSLALLVPAVHWLRRPARVGGLALLAALVPVALLGSYPTVFVAGAVSLALLPQAWSSARGRRWGVCALYLTYNLLMLATFLGYYLLISRDGLDPETGASTAFLKAYWADGFPPWQPLPLARWLVLIHTGRMMAYPVGEANGGSALTFLLFVGGLWCFWGQRRFALMVLWLTPFALGLVAAFLGRYPYGGCCRLSQHVAPVVCLLAGAGAAGLIERLRDARVQVRWTRGVVFLLVVCGAGGVVADLYRPYRDEEALWTRKVVREVLTQAGPDDQIVVLAPRAATEPLLRWQLERLKDARLAWEGAVDWKRLRALGGRAWVLTAWGECPRPSLAALHPPDGGPPWVVLDEITYTLRRTRSGDPTIHYHLACQVPPEGRQTAARPLLSCWP